MNQTVSFTYVLNVHQNLVHDYHCMPGIKDENLLHSAIDGQYWYEPGVDQIIHVAYSICANHVFSDGNKRTTFLVLKLLENDFNYICDWSQIAHIVLDLATNSISREQFHDAIVKAILFF
ncbi:MAG: Fic family protein [Peptococcaceae bacterium]